VDPRGLERQGEWQEIPDILRLGRKSTTVWLATFALTVLADLTVAVEVGMIFAVFVYIFNTTIIFFGNIWEKII
jgi:SulP family sulfate permease